MKKSRNYRRISELQTIKGLKEVVNWLDYWQNDFDWFGLNFWDTCLVTLVVQIFLQKMRTKTELVSKDVESISWDDKTYLKSICWLESPVCRFHGLQPEKKKKWIKFWIRWNEESWENLVKGTQVPVASAIIIHECQRSVPFLRLTSHDELHTSQRLYSVYNDTTTCTMCSIVILCYSGNLGSWPTKSNDTSI
jgi:hypothetical protein